MSPYETQTISYSARNEDTLHVTSLSGQSTTVHKRYDEEGNLLSATRSFSPNQQGIDSLTTSWQYDRANRAFSQTEPDGGVEQRFFDAAGNADSVLSRRGQKLSMTYDSLNRLSTRTLPVVSISLPPSQINPSTPVDQLPYSYSWSADSQSFQYSPDGQVSLATNKDATVTRTFHPNGMVLSETLAIKSTDRATSHTYTTTYRYDRNRRRSSVLAPGLFAGDSMLYRYDASWGALNSVKDIAGNTFSFSYSERSEMVSILYGGGIRDTLMYDDDERLSADRIRNGANQTFPFYPDSTFRRFVVDNRNARGQILTSHDSTMSDQVTATYSGLGYLETSNMRQSLVNGVTRGPASYASGDTVFYDGIGNIITTSFRDSVNVGGGWTVTANPGSNTYTTKGRLNAHTVAGAQTTYSYDASGNSYFERTTSGANVPAERAAYYGPDEKLVATDTRGTGHRVFEEYRYDALGRRVWVRSWTTCEPTNAIDCVTPYVRRVIWDGAQELAEIQVPVDSTNLGIEEMDTGYPLRAFNPAAGLYGDPNPWYGRVVYGPGLGVDQPLSVTRYDYRDLPSSGAQSLTWPRFTWQIYWNYQGVPAYGTLTTGAWAYPYQLGGGQSNCPALGDQTTQRCVIVQWPVMHTAYDQNRGAVGYLSWHGSLLEAKKDRSGLQYKRNRQYDPATGRFTQEDPIELAGGLNLYGFANGDPVNFSDPFGLCPVPADDCPFGYWTSFGATAGLATGAAAGLVLAAPTAELASPITVPTGAAVGASAGAIGGLTADVTFAISRSSLGKAIKRTVDRAIETIGLIVSLLHHEPPPKKPEPDKPPPPAPTSTQTIVGCDRSRESCP